MTLYSVAVTIRSTSTPEQLQAEIETYFHTEYIGIVELPDV